MAEIASYQLKDVAQTLYVHLRDNRPLRSGLVTWEVFMAVSLDRLFHREMSEEKVTEFINLRQGGRNVHEYFWIFLSFPNMLLR